MRYWVAKNVEDQFRNEPRNVGVIVWGERSIAARFIGEKESAAIDRRLLGQRFRYPDIYLQWVAYWREEIAAGRIEFDRPGRYSQLLRRRSWRGERYGLGYRRGSVFISVHSAGFRGTGDAGF